MAFRNPERVSLRECQHIFNLLTDQIEYPGIVRKPEVKQRVGGELIFEVRSVHVLFTINKLIKIPECPHTKTIKLSTIVPNLNPLSIL